MACCLIAAFLSDIFDGILARSFGVETPFLRRLDSIADSIFYLCALAATWLIHPEFIVKHRVILSILLGLELIRYAFDYWKFGREASYHMWSSKLWGITLFLGVFAVLVLHIEGLFLIIAILVGIVADIEGLLISVILTSWQHNVPTIVHALKIRTGENVT